MSDMIVNLILTSEFGARPKLVFIPADDETGKLPSSESASNMFPENRVNVDNVCEDSLSFVFSADEPYHGVGGTLKMSVALGSGGAIALELPSGFLGYLEDVISSGGGGGEI
jgi:hypothetical protein